jgi:anti-sigma factor RsiW
MTLCPYTERISPYYDGEVAAAEAATVSRHLEHCPECAAELKRLGALSALLQKTSAPAGADVMARLHRRLEIMQRNQMVQRFAEVCTALAASVLILCGSLWVREVRVERTPSLPTWESASLEGASGARIAGEPEEEVAHWIVQDLSRTNGYE